MSLQNTIKIAMLSSTEALASFSRRFRSSSLLNRFAPTPAPERLILAPHNLRNADPITARDIYAGRFFFSGQLVELNGQNPFTQDQASKAWKAKLFAFEWLRHLAVSDNTLAVSNAQSHISDWIAAHGKPKRHLSWNLETTSRRIISWIYHSIPIVENSDPAFYRLWMRSFGVHIKFLKYSCGHAPIGLPRLLSRIALAYADICVSDQASYLRNASALLDEELSQQILPDGGHISRNPGVIPEILSFLLPLREAYAKLGKAPSQELVSTIDRLMVALKFYRLGDGEISHFNGSSTTIVDLVSAILRYDDAKGAAPDHATSSNYQRIAKENIILLADTGSNPSGPISKSSHAGTLSFEFSANLTPIILNCGAINSTNPDLNLAARYTAAHNTLTLNNTSSSIIHNTKSSRLFGQQISGPTHVSSARENNTNSTTLHMHHNGYQQSFGLIHHRMLGVDNTGTKIIGEDRLTGPNEKALDENTDHEFAIRFHLNPALSAGKTEDGRSILIMGGNGIAWKFICIDIIPQLEESIFFAANSGPRKTKQIVLYGNTKQISDVRWLFEKQLQEKPARKKKPKPEQLPL